MDAKQLDILQEQNINLGIRIHALEQEIEHLRDEIERINAIDRSEWNAKTNLELLQLDLDKHKRRVSKLLRALRCVPDLLTEAMSQDG